MYAEIWTLRRSFTFQIVFEFNRYSLEYPSDLGLLRHGLGQVTLMNIRSQTIEEHCISTNTKFIESP